MAVGYNPRTITDGLVLALDAGSPKNYNVGSSTNWTDKVGGNNGTLVGGTHHNDGPFVGAGYVEFDGTGDTLTLANNTDHQFGSSDYTIEAWVYLNNLSTVQGLFGRYNTSSAREIYITLNTNGSITHRTSSNGTSFSTHSTSAGLLTANTWHHVAISKSGTNSYIAVDGVVGSGTVDSTLHTASQTTYIGDAVAGSNLLNGNLSNYRILKGTALYTSNFTPPTKSLTAVTNTVLLTCQGNTIADASSSAHTITANGDISLTKEPFGGAGAVEFDGTGDYLSFTKNTTTGSFTCECWFYRGADVSNYHIIFSGDNLGSVNANNVQLQVSNTGAVGWYQGASVISQTGTAVQQNAWNHIAWVRSGTSCAIFVNGSRIATGTNSNALNVTQISTYLSGGYQLNGYISNARIVDAAVYDPAQTTISVPTKPLEPIENTFLLTCQGQNIKDASSNAHTITPNGDVKATIVSSAFKFDGSNDYVIISSSNDFAFGTNDFSIELWAYFQGSGSYENIIDFRPTSTNGNYPLLARDSVDGDLYYYVNSSRIIDNVSVSNNRWYHIVICREGTTTRFYLNGEIEGSATDSTNYITSNVLMGSYSGGGNYFNGKISAVKIYKGKGLTAAEVTQNYNATKGRYA